ncbi:hypothetical protein [Streptomyces sp. NPDC057582]|uniref:hypothetical protein n=1 Tax=Streptomyces sp. NPDC057582 TaxID=3346174 RepID=UPI0036BD67D0
MHNPVVTATIVGPRTAAQLATSQRALDFSDLVGGHAAQARRDPVRPRWRGPGGVRLVVAHFDPRRPHGSRRGRLRLSVPGRNGE